MPFAAHLHSVAECLLSANQIGAPSELIENDIEPLEILYPFDKILSKRYCLLACVLILQALVGSMGNAAIYGVF